MQNPYAVFGITHKINSLKYKIYIFSSQTVTVTFIVVDEKLNHAVIKVEERIDMSAYS